jgi:stress response protein YsnF
LESEGEEQVLPLHEEQVQVARHRRVTGRVSVSTVTRSRDELIDELLTNEHAEIERVVIRQLIDEAPPIRTEGDTVIVPVIEEVLVVERRLFLKEEVHIRRKCTTERHQETVTLREQEIVILRKPGDEATDVVGASDPDPTNP